MDEKLVSKLRRKGSKKRRSLPATLAEANRPMSLPEVFVSAGYNRDLAEDIEQFYIALREELGRSIVPKGDARENAQVVLRDAS